MLGYSGHRIHLSEDVHETGSSPKAIEEHKVAIPLRVREHRFTATTGDEAGGWIRERVAEAIHDFPVYRQAAALKAAQWIMVSPTTSAPPETRGCSNRAS